MRKLRLNHVQFRLIRDAQNNVQEVLRDVKTKQLEGKALADMKNLEQAAVILETIIVCQPNWKRASKGRYSGITVKALLMFGKRLSTKAERDKADHQERWKRKGLI